MQYNNVIKLVVSYAQCQILPLNSRKLNVVWSTCKRRSTNDWIHL